MRIPVHCILALGILLMGSACAVPVTHQPQPGATQTRRGQQPYQVAGVYYYPIPSAQGFVENGTASWYGHPFHGRPTSSGEIYDMHRISAAHKTLPLGTHVKVTRTDTGASLIVRINDRGPFVKNRIIDLSHAAAQALGFTRQGTAPVRIEAVQAATQMIAGEDTHWMTETIPDFRHGLFTIQAGAFNTPLNAARLQERLIAAGYARAHIVHTDGGLYRVRLQTFTDLIRAHLTAAQLEHKGFTRIFVMAVEETASPDHN